MTCVVDASVIGPLLIPDEADDIREGLLELLVAGEAIVPRHWYLEIANMGLMAVRRGRLDSAHFETRLGDFHDFPLTVDEPSSAIVIRRTAQLARAHDLTIYDAVYLELAHRRGLALLTTDTELRDAAKAKGVELA